MGRTWRERIRDWAINVPCVLWHQPAWRFEARGQTQWMVCMLCGNVPHFRRNRKLGRPQQQGQQ